MRRVLPVHHAARSRADDVIDAWLAADLGLTREDLARGAAVLEEARDWTAGRAVGHLQHPAHLPAIPRGARDPGGDRSPSA